MKTIRKVKNYIQPYIPSTTVFLVGSYLISQDLRPFYQPWIINNQANAWSSMFYALVPVPLLLLKLPMVTLGIVSFSLWANSNTLVNFIDVTCIFWVIVIVTLYGLPHAPYNSYVIYTVNGICTAYICTVVVCGYHAHVLAYYDANLVQITGIILMFSAMTLTSHYGVTPTYLFGSSSIIVGFICKLFTIYLGQYWGTCIFHTLTALGIYYISQLPGEQTRVRKISHDIEQNMI